MSRPVLADEAAGPSKRTGLPGLLDSIVTWWGLAGGLLFCALVLMSIVSTVGRKLFSSPITGDMELLEMMCAVGAATFLPLCELHDHHIKVDALTTWMSDRGRAALDAVAHGLLMISSMVLTWRTALYVMEAKENMEVSTLLLVPLWQPVALMVPSFILLSLTALYRVGVSLKISLGVNQ